MTLKAKWHENDFGIFIKGVKATITIQVYMHHVPYQKKILVLQYYLILKNYIGDRGFELWVFLDQNTKIYFQITE